jgi:hypothetical protein
VSFAGSLHAVEIRVDYLEKFYVRALPVCLQDKVFCCLVFAETSGNLAKALEIQSRLN